MDEPEDLPAVRLDEALADNLIDAEARQQLAPLMVWACAANELVRQIAARAALTTAREVADGLPVPLLHGGQLAMPADPGRTAQTAFWLVEAFLDPDLARRFVATLTHDELMAADRSGDWSRLPGSRS